MANFHIIETGYFWADGGAMFGPIPKKYWHKRYPSN
ncbi:MAG TPA: MBL fold metallo-hydrolase, partial [Porphyromonadaceae bacterium]|nr:MBL fold metallo-hydrolase [Porphyromonadaceae bacterium]